MATQGATIYKSELVTRRPEFGSYTVSVAYSVANNGNIAISTIASAGTGWTNNWLLHGFTSGNSLVFPWNVDQQSNLRSIYTGSTTPTSTFTIVRGRFKFPASTAQFSTGDNYIRAKQLNAINVIFKTFTFEGSTGKIAARASKEITLSPTESTSGWTLYGITSWQAGYTWFAPWKVWMNGLTSATIGITNLHASNTYPTDGDGGNATARIRALGYQLLYTENTTQKSRVASPNLVYASNLNNLIFDANKYRKEVSYTVEANKINTAINLSGSVPSGWNNYPDPGAVTSFSTGSSSLIPRAVAPGTCMARNISGSNITATFNAYIGEYKWT